MASSSDATPLENTMPLRLDIKDAHAPAPVAVPADAGSGSFPSPQALDRLLEVFWQRHHSVELCSFLHRASFEAELLEKSNTFIVCSIIALSSLYISDADAQLQFDFPSALALSDHYVQRCRELSRSSSDDPTGKNDPI